MSPVYLLVCCCGVVCNTERAMKKFLINLVCCFVPSGKMRHKIRRFAKRTKSRNNIIEIVKADGRRVRVKRVPGCRFDFTGDNNHVVLHEPLGKLTLDVNVSWGVYIELGTSTQWQRKIRIVKQFGNKETNRVVIGDELKTTAMVNILLGHGGGDVIIGDDCMFAVDVVFRTGDFHTIYSTDDGRVLNFNQSINIGNHVWLGERVLVLKGARVSDNSIVGARSLVNKKFEQSNIIIAGVPARIVKENVNWDKRPPYHYALDNGQV